jgi:hypothetical protein
MPSVRYTLAVLLRLLIAAAMLSAEAPAARAGLFGTLKFNAGSRAGPISLRKRVHVNTLITEPGTVEIEWGSAFSMDGSFTFPTTIKYTPEGRHVYWGRTEFSASFDSLASSLQPEGRTNHFSDRATFAANCVVHDGDKLDLALAPLVSVLLRGDAGVRLGATAIARYDAGRSSLGVTLTWTAGTAASDTNPAGTFDLGAGYGFRLKPSGPLGHLTPHVNWLYEKSTGADRQISLFEGVEYQITEKIAVDFSGQHFGVWGGQADNQVVVGLTANLGKLR